MRVINVTKQKAVQPLTEQSLISVGVSPNGELYWLEISSEPDYSYSKNADFPTFTKIQPSKPANYSINYLIGEKVHTISLLNQELNFHSLVSLEFPNKWLVLNHRSFYCKEKEEADKNCLIIDASGREIAKLCLGDGIEKIIYLNNEIWASYFDEGIFGNFGWENPLGMFGLVAWNQNGKKLYEFNHEGFDRIDDCYAMNTDGNNLYIHYYSSFPIVEINSAKRPTKLEIDFKGSDFAVFHDFFLFKKAYTRDGLLYLFKKTFQKLELLETFEIHSETSILDHFRTITYGKYMIMIKGKDVYYFDLEKLMKQENLICSF